MEENSQARGGENPQAGEGGNPEMSFTAKLDAAMTAINKGESLPEVFFFQHAGRPPEEFEPGYVHALSEAGGSAQSDYVNYAGPFEAATEAGRSGGDGHKDGESILNRRDINARRKRQCPGGWSGGRPCYPQDAESTTLEGRAKSPSHMGPDEAQDSRLAVLLRNVLRPG